MGSVHESDVEGCGSPELGAEGEHGEARRAGSYEGRSNAANTRD